MSYFVLGPSCAFWITNSNKTVPLIAIMLVYIESYCKYSYIPLTLLMRCLSHFIIIISKNTLIIIKSIILVCPKSNWSLGFLHPLRNNWGLLSNSMEVISKKAGPSCICSANSSCNANRWRVLCTSICNRHRGIIFNQVCIYAWLHVFELIIHLFLDPQHYFSPIFSNLKEQFHASSLFFSQSS